MANDVFHCIQSEITNDSGVCSELDEWLEAIKQIQSQIEDAERARAAAMTTATRLESLEEQYNRKKMQPRGQGSSIFGGLTHTNEQDLEDLSTKIAETKTVKESLFKDYDEARTKVESQVSRIMNQRFALFDRIYVQILESQHDFYMSSARHVSKFEKAIKYYRKQFPKQGSSENSISHVSHASRHSRGSLNNSRGSFGSLRGSPKKSQQQQHLHQQQQQHSHQQHSQNLSKDLVNPPNNVSNPNNDNLGAFRKKYQSVTDLLDFGDNNTSSSRDKLTNNNSINNSGNNLNNNNKNSISNNNRNSNGRNDSKIGMNSYSREDENKSHNDSNTNINNNGARPALVKENSFDLMAGFGGSSGNGNGNGIGNAGGKNINGNGKGILHKKKQESYFDVWGPLVNASSGGISLFGDPVPESNPIQSATPSQQRSGGGTSGMNSNNGSNGNGAPSNGVELRSASSGAASTGVGRGGAGAGAGAGATGLTEKQKKRANKVAQERYEQIQRQFEIEDKERAERQDAFDKHGSRIDEWEYDAKGVRRNLRTLLIKLPDVLWENSGWKPVNLGSLVNVNQCKKHYRKAVRLVHPDRSAHRGDTTERKAICERIFEGLNAAWAEEFGKQ